MNPLQKFLLESERKTLSRLEGDLARAVAVKQHPDIIAALGRGIAQSKADIRTLAAGRRVNRRDPD
jgi:hypothetical protein